MVKDYFMTRYVAETLDIGLNEAQNKMEDESLFTKRELNTLGDASGIRVEYLTE